MKRVLFIGAVWVAAGVVGYLTGLAVVAVSSWL